MFCSNKSLVINLTSIILFQQQLAYVWFLLYLCLFDAQCVKAYPLIVIYFPLHHSHEAMSDLIYLLDNLVDVKGNILVPEINEHVAPLTDDERATYTDIDFDKVSEERGYLIVIVTLAIIIVFSI